MVACPPTQLLANLIFEAWGQIKQASGWKSRRKSLGLGQLETLFRFSPWPLTA